jgi:hypothetical protein
MKMRRRKSEDRWKSILAVQRPDDEVPEAKFP